MFDRLLIGLSFKLWYFHWLSYRFVYRRFRHGPFLLDQILVFFGSDLGSLWCFVGHHGAVLGQCWALLERMENAKGPKLEPQIACWPVHVDQHPDINDVAESFWRAAAPYNYVCVHCVSNQFCISKVLFWILFLDPFSFSLEVIWDRFGASWAS